MKEYEEIYLEVRKERGKPISYTKFKKNVNRSYLHYKENIVKYKQQGYQIENVLTKTQYTEIYATMNLMDPKFGLARYAAYNSIRYTTRSLKRAQKKFEESRLLFFEGKTPKDIEKEKKAAARAAKMPKEEPKEEPKSKYEYSKRYIDKLWRKMHSKDWQDKEHQESYYTNLIEKFRSMAETNPDAAAEFLEEELRFSQYRRRYDYFRKLVVLTGGDYNSARAIYTGKKDKKDAKRSGESAEEAS
uniref:Uncharacterized protein n=1 Tax=virus sp. ctK6s94 TaxID=2826798 RepID=A0A8S5MFD1_9VIRU|nr:MAG TPA: hypothetical protein [virus sp. ctK6s94]